MAESDFFFDFSPYYRHFSEKDGDNTCNMNWCHEVTLQQRQRVRTQTQKSHLYILN